MNTVIDNFLIPILPVMAFVLSALLLIIIECIKRPSLRPLSNLLGILGPIGAIAATCYLFKSSSLLVFSNAALGVHEAWLGEFINSYNLDEITLAWYWAIGAFSFIGFVFVESYFQESEDLPEILILIQFIAAGMMLLVSANSLLMVFMALELMSLPTYVLVGIEKGKHFSAEASLKYFLFGSFASVLLLFSIALLYSYTGTLQLGQISSFLRAPLGGETSSGILVLAASALFIVAIGFKIGLVPFHMWLPDVYVGAPTPITGFMGSAIKLAGFGLALRLWWGMLGPISSHWTSILGTLSVVTMFVGNLAALQQRNLKRLFAYSSIAHAGYLVLGLISVSKVGSVINHQSIFYYLVVYGFMFLGAFGILALIEKESGSADISNIEGMGFSNPILGLCLTVFVLSAAGIPPTAGFLGKYLLFVDAIRAGHTTLVVLAVLSSVIGVYYYLRIIVALFMTEPSQKIVLPIKKGSFLFCIIACAFLMFFFALFPNRLGI